MGVSHSFSLSYYFVLGFFLLSISKSVFSLDASGRIGFESRYFFGDKKVQAGALFEPEFYWASKSGDDTFTLKIFGRYDELDDERSYIDIREALWLHIADSWEFRAGIGKVFWGVTESNHLVDIVNQTDFVESADGEQKLGQPMLHFTKLNDWGVVDLFVLPGFRERTFPGPDGRLGGPFFFGAENVFYEDSKENRHVDYAFRYSHYMGVFDFGLSGFTGTNREPQLIFGDTIQLLYDQLGQLGLDVQATLGDWLIKFEAVCREDSIETYFAQTVGFEYTLPNMFDRGFDLGLLTEYSFDDRAQNIAPLDNDIFLGARFTLNDVQSTELLIGASQDLDRKTSRLLFIEGSRRIGGNWKATLDARVFSASDQDDPLFFIRDEDYSSLTIEWYY